MPLLTRVYVRTSLVCLVAALVVGVLLLAGFGAWQPVYFHVLMVGWVTQLIFGIVYWMFPKYSAERPRGNERLGWAVYVLLNAGLVLRVAGEGGQALWPSAAGILGPVLALAAILQWFAGLGFVVTSWPRVKER